ncbi:YybH family protein [Massilia sp. LXY-6]|uniref:YybH family protein n=1 Tax=Massilia sp. LXY-6 TaxID=3379823 RepID=UPI003EE32E1E
MALKDEIQAAQDRLAEAVSARDASGAASLYTEDARLIPQGGPACASSDAIAAFFAGSFDKGIVGARFTTNEVDGDDAQATEIGNFELDAMLPGGERVLAAQGRYLIVWRKTAGEWRIHRDMFNT